MRLQLLQPPDLQGVRDGRADPGVVLVVAGSLQLHGLAVQQEALGAVEGDRADAEAGDMAVDHGAADLHLGDQAVEVRGLQRPEDGAGQGHGQRQRLALPGRQAAGRGGGGQHRLAGAVQHGVQQLELGPGVALVGQVGVDGQGPVDLGADEHAPLRHVDRGGLDQPDVAIEARALVEPALAQAGVDPHHQTVFLADVGDVGDVDAERAVAAVLLFEDVAVDDDQGVAHRAVELDRQSLACVGGGQGEGSLVPADAGLGELAAQGFVAVGGAQVLVVGLAGRDVGGIVDEGQLDGPVVGQGDGRPGGGVEGGIGQLADLPVGGGRASLGEGALVGPEAEVAGRILGVAQLEAPVEVQRQALARGQVDGGKGGERGRGGLALGRGGAGGSGGGPSAHEGGGAGGGGQGLAAAEIDHGILTRKAKKWGGSGALPPQSQDHRGG
jgi:hypothetical protein